ENPKHIEIQILADKHGNVIYLGERDCSIQRKSQKIIEECPSASERITKKVREKMAKVSIAAAKAAKYEGAGTIEYLVGDDGNFYFMEMNTRIQVEHGITELVTGIDIVKSQITVAYGERLPFSQKDIHFSGHAIECRINAENPHENFRPCPGKITSLYVPGGPGIRIDSCVYAGYKIPPYYDSMIGKLMAFAPTRKEAIAKMKWALAEFIVGGIDTNIDYHLDILGDSEFISGEYNIGFLENR
ncbi:MAG: acetyl-CoA carboxylase biotin carboxylase subunit, partial [Oscillospiraceae bacterium]